MFILTEKPSVAKDIANALGRFEQRDNRDCIVHTVGHVLEYKPIKSVKEQLKIIKYYDSSNFTLATDAERG